MYDKIGIYRSIFIYIVREMVFKKMTYRPSKGILKPVLPICFLLQPDVGHV